jgi:hypothetical protein
MVIAHSARLWICQTVLLSVPPDIVRFLLPLDRVASFSRDTPLHLLAQLRRYRQLPPKSQ